MTRRIARSFQPETGVCNCVPSFYDGTAGGSKNDESPNRRAGHELWIWGRLVGSCEILIGHGLELIGRGFYTALSGSGLYIQPITSLRVWNASANPDGALHSRPRSRITALKVSGVNQALLRWVPKSSMSRSVFFCMTSSANGE